MDEAPALERLAPALAAAQRVLESFPGRGLVIGGVAAALIGRPRFTADVDLVLMGEIDELPSVLEEAAKHGLRSRVADMESFVRATRVVALTHEPSGVGVDISLGVLPFEQEAVDRGRMFDHSGLRIPVPTPEDLIIFKAVAHRPQDLEDIRSIVAAHPDVDRRRVERWVREFAEALDAPELWEDIAALLPAPS